MTKSLIFLLGILTLAIFSNTVYAQETNSSNETTVSEISNDDLLAYAIIHLKQAIIDLRDGNSTGLIEELTVVTEQTNQLLRR